MWKKSRARGKTAGEEPGGTGPDGAGSSNAGSDAYVSDTSRSNTGGSGTAVSDDAGAEVSGTGATGAATSTDVRREPALTAPSPADGPTMQQPVVASEDLDRPDDRGTGPRPGPVERDTDRLPGGTAGAAPAHPDTVPDPAGPSSGARGRPTRTTAKPGPGLTRVGGTWLGLILGAVILIFLLIFIVQNPDPSRVYFLGLQAELPLGIWMLFSAIAGVLLLAIPGLGRMMQWRKSTRPPKR